MVYLGEISVGRNNNLNLVRMIAALGVLVSHAWPIALGPGTTQPLEQLTGVTLGHICVYIFFAISGFLIAGSFVGARSLTEFVLARGLRLLPALIVSLLIVALLMGPLVSELPATTYLADTQTWSFLFRNTTLAFPQYTLPGVFEDNPYPTVEGSIWTLIHEALCYGAVFAVGVLGLLARPKLAAIVLVLYVLAGFVVVELDLAPHPRLASFLSLSSIFALGMLAFVCRDKVPMSFGIVVALALVAALAKGTFVYPLIFAVALCYAAFWFGYVPGGAVRTYNRVGDYSYGIYIYAFPAQGLAIWLAGSMGPWENIAWALPLTLVPSILSWHLVERPALRSRHSLADRLSGNTTRQVSSER